MLGDESSQRWHHVPTCTDAGGNMAGAIVKAAAIIAAAIVASTALQVYFSPYQTCVRDEGEGGPLRCIAAGGKFNPN